MSAQNFNDLVAHKGHRVEVVTYGSERNVAAECVDCSVVLLDFDKEEPWFTADGVQQTRIVQAALGDTGTDFDVIDGREVAKNE